MTKPRRPRMRPWVLRLDTATEHALRTRAAAHSTTLAAYARAAIQGRRPGGVAGQVASAADDWWDSLPPSRRAQVHGWLTPGGRGLDGGEHPDQLVIFDAKEGPK